MMGLASEANHSKTSSLASKQSLDCSSVFCTITFHLPHPPLKHVLLFHLFVRCHRSHRQTG